MIDPLEEILRVTKIHELAFMYLTEGGYFVPEEFINTEIKKLQFFMV